MKQRGKKSAAKLAVVAPHVIQRPAAPDDLLPHERELWDSITDGRDPTFFEAGTIPLLTEYCRLKTQVDVMAEEIEDFDPAWLKTDEGIKRYKSITAIRDQAQGRMIALARSMRLTQQARYVPDKAATHSKGKKSSARLWQRD